MSLKLDCKVQVGACRLDLTADLQAPITALMGPSGVGKTTLFKCVLGLLPATSGIIAYNHTTWQGPDAWLPPQKRRIGYLPQELALFPNMTVAQNLAFGLAVQHLPKAARRERTAATAAYLGIAGLLGRSVNQLSGGERQRVALGRALVIHPQLLLLDEPFTGLDEKTRQACLALVRKISEDTGVQALVITHYREEAQALGAQVLQLEAGHLQ